MKYIITEMNEVVVGINTFHSEMARHVIGKVVRAGHCEMDGNTCIRVWGSSIGYGIQSKPEDRDIINSHEVLHV